MDSRASDRLGRTVKLNGEKEATRTCRERWRLINHSSQIPGTQFGNHWNAGNRGTTQDTEQEDKKKRKIIEYESESEVKGRTQAKQMNNSEFKEPEKMKEKTKTKTEDKSLNLRMNKK